MSARKRIWQPPGAAGKTKGRQRIRGAPGGLGLRHCSYVCCPLGCALLGDSCLLHLPVAATFPPGPPHPEPVSRCTGQAEGSWLKELNASVMAASEELERQSSSEGGSASSL